MIESILLKTILITIGGYLAYSHEVQKKKNRQLEDENTLISRVIQKLIEGKQKEI